jgi:hypothetical protein
MRTVEHAQEAPAADASKEGPAPDASQDDLPSEFESLPAESPSSLLSLRWLWWLAGVAFLAIAVYLAWQIAKGNLPW